MSRQCPLFPNYVFVQVARDERVKVLCIPGVLSIVGTSREGTALPSAEIEALRNGLLLHDAMPHPFLDVGEKVRIRNGALAGMEGIVLRGNNRARIVLSLDLIMQSISVEVEVVDVEPIVPRISNIA